jgi:hypothetical protein
MDHSASRQMHRPSFHGQGLDFLGWGLRFSGVTLEDVGVGRPMRGQVEGGPGPRSGGCLKAVPVWPWRWREGYPGGGMEAPPC